MEVMTHIPREIRKKLETSLPSYVLEFLTEKFSEFEKYCDKSKELERKVQMLEEQLNQKDQTLMQMYYRIMDQEKQSQFKPQIGYDYQIPIEKQFEKQLPLTMHYKPWEEDLEYREMFPEYRRGRSSRNEFSGRRGGSRSDFMAQGQGGGGGQQSGQGSGGSQSGGGQQGGGSTSAQYNVMPDTERIPKRQFPTTEDAPYTERGQGLPEEY